MQTKEKKIAAWKRRKNAPKFNEKMWHDGTTACVTMQTFVTICDGKFDSDWDNVPSDMDGNETVEPSATQWT